MFPNLALSGGAHLCIPFIGFLRAVRPLVRRARWVSGCSGGALVGAAWVLDIPDQQVMRILARHMSAGILGTPDISCLIDRLGLVDVETTIGAMCREMITAGLAHWRTFKQGMPPDLQGDSGGTLTMLALSKLTGKSLAIGVCDASAGFAETYITADTHPDLHVWRALAASCAVPFAFTPVAVGDSVFCDACVRDNSPVRGIPGAPTDGMVDTLVLEVEVIAGAVRPVSGRPANLMEFGKGVLSAMIDRVSNCDAQPRARVITLPRWTEERLGPMVLGATSADILAAYAHGVRCGKDFLDDLSKETAAS
eukprot:jgi/Tetstr1/454002/TSEL_040921.t1